MVELPHEKNSPEGASLWCEGVRLLRYEEKEKSALMSHLFLEQPLPVAVRRGVKSVIARCVYPTSIITVPRHFRASACVQQSTAVATVAAAVWSRNAKPYIRHRRYAMNSCLGYQCDLDIAVTLARHVWYISKRLSLSFTVCWLQWNALKSSRDKLRLQQTSNR